MADLTNFSGSAADMLSMMKAAGISEDAAEEAAKSAAAAAPSEPEECTDPTHDHSHGWHHHGHAHAHSDRSVDTGNDHGDGHGHDHDHGHDHHGDDDEDAAAVAEAAAAAAEEAATAENALRENIARKGKNAYYYAHASSANGPKWDGDPTPRLLETKRSSSLCVGEGGEAGADAARAAPPPVVKKIAKFAWADEKGKVKVYIDFSAIGITSPKVDKEVSFTSRSVTLKLTPAVEDKEGNTSKRGVVHLLDFPELNDSIEKATCMVKPTKAILTLTKAADSDFTWHELRKKH